MQFRTQIPIPKSANPIDYNSRVVSLGSCFAENISDKFQYFKFQKTTNPFGIIFNPVSIEKIIHKAMNEEMFTENDVFFHNEHWHSFDAHSDLSNERKEELLESLNTILKLTKSQLEAATHIIITYGTSWVYRNIERDVIVANCHKVPQKQFTKELLSVEVIKESIEKTMALIALANPKAKLIFTVSPVRHTKDGFVENQWSKANLITSIHNLLSDPASCRDSDLQSEGNLLPIAIGTANCKLQSEYFPSYEIMMDELRDYRFYAEDMLHPNQVAIDYIWERFKETNISESAYPVMEEVETIQKSLAHKPFNPNSESHKKFVSKLKEKITKLVSRYPFMKF